MAREQGRTITIPGPLARRLELMARERGRTFEEQVAEHLNVCLEGWESDERPYRLRAGLPLEG